MIFYFTGTGNSLYAARQLDPDCISIPQVIHRENLAFSSSVVGVVCPIYGHEMPAMVKDFLRRAQFHSEYFYLILTYGLTHGGAAELAEQFLASCGKQADYINMLCMVDNYLPSFDMDEQRMIDPEKQADAYIAAIRDDITARKHWKYPVTQQDRDWHQTLLTRLHKDNFGMNPWANLYNVADNCLGCRICIQVCPVGCIVIQEGKAFHTDVDCQACMACIHACPQRAIRLNMPEKNPNARYRNEHITLEDLIVANKQMN